MTIYETEVFKTGTIQDTGSHVTGYRSLTSGGKINKKRCMWVEEADKVGGVLAVRKKARRHRAVSTSGTKMGRRRQ